MSPRFIIPGGVRGLAFRWDELGDHLFHLVGADRIANAVRCHLRRWIDRGECRDADELALQIDQRASAVARIDRGTRLDHARQRMDVAIHQLGALAIKRADDPRGGGLLQAERTAHRDVILADLDLAGIADGDGLEVARANLENGEILGGHVPDELRGDRGARRKQHREG